VIAENNLLFDRALSESSSECELCGNHPAEHFMETPWAERHICSGCAESLPRNNRCEESSSRAELSGYLLPESFERRIGDDIENATSVNA